MALRISSSDLASRYDNSQIHFIGRISFEERSLVVPRALSAHRGVTGTAFMSRGCSDLSNQRGEELKALHPEITIVQLNTNKPIECAREIQSAVEQYRPHQSSKTAVIDVTSFRREELLMLLAALQALPAIDTVRREVLYVSAASMADDWMTRNVVSHRSVVGYAGEIWPSRQTKLVLLMGFELIRAKSIIENYEPAEVLLGMGSFSNSVSAGLHARNLGFFESLTRQFPNVQQFEFSATDPLETLRDLEKAISLDEQSNIIVAPLHTKLSTIGAGLYALKHPRVQVCYAQVGEYNETAYSTPGDAVYVLQLDDLVG